MLKKLCQAFYLLHTAFLASHPYWHEWYQPSLPRMKIFMQRLSRG